MNDKDYYNGLLGKVAGRLALLFIGILIGCALIFFMSRHGSNNGKTVVERDTVFDTLVFEKPVPVHDTIVRHVKRKPILLHDTTIVLQKDTNVYITPDTQVVIPITQKVYKDSCYRAWVSGYMPSLDRIEIYRPTITIKEYERKRWNWGLQGGAGIDVLTGKPTIYLGFGGTLSF